MQEKAEENFKLWREILEYARWSPSPHNVQPWKVKILTATDAELYYDPKRLLPDEDPTGCFLTTGFGIFLETLDVAASPLGQKVAVVMKSASLNSKQDGLQLLATLNLVPRIDRDPLDRELIMSRRTSRLPYKKQPIDEAVVKELQAIAMDFGQTFAFSSESTTVDWVLKLNRDTMFYDMNDDKARTEVGQWIRYTTREAHEKKDGLWTYCMNVATAVMYLFFYARWIINLPGIYQLSGKLYMTTMKGTSTVGWLSGPFKDSTDWINSGRMMARLWLTMTKHDVYLHPFGSIITNETAHQRLRKKFKVNEHENTLWLVMRLGYSELPPRSMRKDLEDIIL